MKPSSRRPVNRILSSLPKADFARLAPSLRTFDLTPKLTLHRPNEEITEIIFPDGGVVSITTMMRDGSCVEVATVGAEGLVGINAFLGGTMANGESMVQVPGSTATAMPVGVFKREMENPGPFREHVRRYGQGVIALMMQSAACLALHGLRSRCCRWLLMAHDRVGADQFQLNQEYLAAMLGSTRQSVNVIAKALQRSNVVRYRYARVTILDRAKLEAGACECYATIQEQFARLQL